MTDVVVRAVPDDVVAGLEARAARLGLSRSEFLRQLLVRETSANAMSVSVEDLEMFSATFTDLADPEVMRGAWEESAEAKQRLRELGRAAEEG